MKRKLIGQNFPHVEKNDVRPLFQTGRKGAIRKHWMVELPATEYWKLVKKEFMYLGIDRYRVRGFCQPRMCQKFMRFGDQTVPSGERGLFFLRVGMSRISGMPDAPGTAPR